jgi:hypothetical protein
VNTSWLSHDSMMKRMAGVCLEITVRHGAMYNDRQLTRTSLKSNSESAHASTRAGSSFLLLFHDAPLHDMQVSRRMSARQRVGSCWVP